MSVLLETTRGNIVLIYTHRMSGGVQELPEIMQVKYYNNCMFFNVQKNFIIQTGDPTNTGKGGESV